MIDRYSFPNVRRIPFLADREFDVQEFTITMKNGENASAEHVYVIAHDVYSAAGTLVLGYGSLADESCASVGETLKRVCTAAWESSVRV